MGAHVSWQFNISSLGEPPQRISGGVVSYDFLPVLGAQPLLGQLFSPQEDQPGAGQFVMLSYAFWKNRFGADPHIVGKPIQIDGVPYTVIGVMPAGFNGFDGKELLWTLLQLRRDSGIGSSPNLHWLGACIRLPDGVSLARGAERTRGRVAARLHRQNPSSDAGFGVFLQTLNDAFTGNVRPALLLLMGCVGFVLLIACANVANLLLARGAARQREMAVRTALGASPYRIVRQLLTESVMLAGAGGATGIALAFVLAAWNARHPSALGPSVSNKLASTVRSLIYSLLVSWLSEFSLDSCPAIEAARVDVNDSLREHGGFVRSGIWPHRSILVIAETALSCMLLIGTGLAL